jgi:hypothetical protein
VKTRKTSSIHITESGADAGLGLDAVLCVAIRDEKGNSLPARCILKDGNNFFVDAGGRGIAEGETPLAGGFYADGGFECELAAGICSLEVEAGNHMMPFSKNIALEAGRRYAAEIALVKWFDPKGDGWFCGDCHFHIYHGGIHCPVQTRLDNGALDYDYMKLAARAEGLDFAIGGPCGSGYTQAEVDRETRRLSEKHFVFSGEAEQGALWSGHTNPIGCKKIIRPSLIENTPLPLLKIRKRIGRVGGVLNYTHPVSFPDACWLSSIEVFSHAALGEEGGLFDVGTLSHYFDWPFRLLQRELALRELFFFWSIGFKLAASGTSDAQLEQGFRMGSARTYIKADGLSYGKVVTGMRERHTVASAGAVFATLSADERYQAGDEIPPGRHTVALEAHARAGLSRIELIIDGTIDRIFTPRGRRHFTKKNIQLALKPGSWVTILTRDTENGFSLPTALFAHSSTISRGDFCLLCISDADKAVRARGDMFLYLMSTVQRSAIEEVTIYRNEKPVLNVGAKDGDNIPVSGVPLSRKETWNKHPRCETGWLFHPTGRNARHVQLCYRVTKHAWYRAEVKRADGKVIDSGAVLYPTVPSATAALLTFDGENARFCLETFGEECTGMPRAARYDIDAYINCVIQFPNGPYHFDRVGRPEQGKNFRRPAWAR